LSFRAEIKAEPWRFDLFAALRRLERESPDKPRIGDGVRPEDLAVVLSQNPYMAFPASTLEAADDLPGGKLRLTVRFLGMFGPQGALPLATTAESYAWLLERDDAFPRFVDLFQRRFLELFYRAWADARPIAHADRPDDDRFVQYVNAMIGVGSPAYLKTEAAAPFAKREMDSLHRYAKAEFAGLIAPKAKSAGRLEQFLAGLLRAKVEIFEFIGSWLVLDRADQSRVGMAMATLGVDCLAGSSQFTVGDKFRARVYVRDFEQYLKFLPGGELARTIADAIFLMLGDEFDWDMELAIPAGEVQPVKLGLGARLGWTSWMSPNWAKTDETYRTDSRFNVVSRIAAQAAG
jgi:type VI secretion system protein ImpH